MPDQHTTVQRFRKLPVVIDAIRWDGHNTVEVIDWILATGKRSARWHEETDLDTTEWIVIDTLEGVMTATLGDWIIRGVQGEHYPCKPDIFAATYEPVEATQ